jgi:hypothetical protein
MQKREIKGCRTCIFPKLLERGFLCTNSTSLWVFTSIRLADGLGASEVIFAIVDVCLVENAIWQPVHLGATLIMYVCGHTGFKHMTDNFKVWVAFIHRHHRQTTDDYLKVSYRAQFWVHSPNSSTRLDPSTPNTANFRSYFALATSLVHLRAKIK